VPTKPAWLKGSELKHVYTIPKDKVYLDAMLENLSALKKVLVVGAGFIGVEVSDELNKRGYKVTLLEIEEHLVERGVEVVTRKGVSGVPCRVSLDQGSRSDREEDALERWTAYRAVALLHEQRVLFFVAFLVFSICYAIFLDIAHLVCYYNLSIIGTNMC